MADYKTYSEYLAERFPGGKVQKISVNTGTSCPNRDGTIGHGGCVYCNNASFTPGYVFGATSVAEQLERGKEFFARKYPTMRYLAYFQSFTATYGISPDQLLATYLEAARTPGVAGIIVGTRPDCIDSDTLEVLREVNRQIPVMAELGAETFHNRTLRLIHRGHTAECTADTTRRLAEAGISTGLHLIFGLPGESRADMLESLRLATSLPIDTIKFHHMQIIAATELARQWNEGLLTPHSAPPAIHAEPSDITIWSPEEYARFCREVIASTPSHIAIERFLASAPPAMLIQPRWGMKNHEFANLLNNKHFS